MTAARHDLELITAATPARTDDDCLTVGEDDADWRADSVIERWAPEHQLIGALLWLSADRARPILEVVPDTAIWRPLAQWAYQIIGALVADGRDPNPVIVLSTAARHGWHQDGDQPPTPARHHQLALYLSAAYTNAVSPAVAAGDHARQVLDAAFARAFRDNGIRMQQLGESSADRCDLATQFTRIRDDLTDLWRRCEIAARPGWWRP